MTDASDTPSARPLPPPLPQMPTLTAEPRLAEAASAANEPPRSESPAPGWSLSAGERIVPPPSRERGRPLLLMGAVAAALTAGGAAGLLWSIRQPEPAKTATATKELPVTVVDAKRAPLPGTRTADPMAAPASPPPPVETAALPMPAPATPPPAPQPVAKAPEAAPPMKPTIMNAPAPGAAKAAASSDTPKTVRSDPLPPPAARTPPQPPRQTARAPMDGPPEEDDPRGLRPPSADSRDPVQMRAAAAGLHPQLPRDLLARLTSQDLRNADIAIQTALAESVEGEVFIWPRQRWPEQAHYQVRLLRSTAPGCRRYVVTVAKDGWSTTAPPMETCDSAPRIARERDRRPPPWVDDRYR